MSVKGRVGFFFFGGETDLKIPLVEDEKVVSTAEVQYAASCRTHVESCGPYGCS